MKKIYESIFFLILFLQWGWTQDSLTVISYNIQGQRPGTNPEIRLQHIIQHLKTLNPDIIGLQEINEDINGSGEDNQGQIIADSLSAYFDTTYHFYQEFTHLSWDAQFREYVGIISKYPVEQEDFLALPKGTFNRKVVWNYINTPLGKVNFFNTHLSFNSNDVRIRQVEAMLPYIKDTAANNPGEATIITGDFNATPKSEPIRLLTYTGNDTFYFDSYREINPFSTGFTVPADNPDRKIDYVFYESTGGLEISRSKIIMDATYNGIDPISDHLGVLSTFKMRVSNSQLHFNPYLEFGESTVWTRIDTIIFLSNQGSENTNIYSIYSSDPVFSADQIEFIIPAGDSGELTLSFIPDAGISYEAVIIIENSTGRDRPMFLTGTGVTLTFDDIIDFGPVLVGSPKDSTIVITNPTNEEILVSNVVSENPEFSVESTTFSVPPQSEYLLTLTFTPQNTGLTEGQLTLMSNAGNPSFNLTGIGLEPSSWKIQQSGVIDDLLDVHFADSLTAWIVGNAGTILKTIDAGLSWEAQSSGTTLSLRSVHFPDTNSGWAVGANGTILKTTDGGQEWIAESSGTNALLTSVYFISPSLGWVTGTNGVVLRTENGGQEWQTIASFGFNTITSVYFVTNDTGWVVGTYGFIRKTTNGGDVWDIQTSPSENHLWSVQFTNLSNGWIVGEKGELLKTDDGGTSWIEQAVVLTPDFAGLELISAESYWIVGDEGTILKSFNGGEVWIPQYSGTSSNLNSVSFGSKHNGVIVGTGGLILNTTNGGVVAIDGQHRPDIKGPYQYSLSQNYPNPFNPVTKINYVLPVTNYVNLSIFNLLGELLTTLVDEKQNAGYHQVEWDASGFASGVYYYRMDAGDYHDAKKMILLR